ncbi:hypothetical protein EB796_024080 [Bugula neritina]|uniref:Uncharacterized protein n=1 Tax=Bugula neritina TaxID=10212 RepID=A0A7J7IUJ9_BUGNE|nr:hypothetical protein EB796_024080 [Bugula neritina]
MKDLEVMMINTISSAFETISTVEQGVELLDIFMHLQVREPIKRALDKRTVEVYTTFNEELNAVKKELTGKALPLPFNHPKYAGSAQWCRLLKKRIEREMMVLDRAHFLPHMGIGEETRTQYQHLCQALDENIRKTFQEWGQTVDRDPAKLLEVPLMARSTEQPPMIDINFSKSLTKMFQEIVYWERLLFEIPHYATDTYNKCEELRILREHVLLVVRDYNRIISALSLEERNLFKERIKFLDKKIHPGLTKLTWGAKNISDYFIKDCRVHANRIQTIVNDYKHANSSISNDCRRISELLLVRIDGKKIYENLEFDDDQQKHRAATKEKLMLIHKDVVSTMKQTYEVFKADGADVQTQWVKYTEKMDRMVEEAFRLNVKWSLQELSRAINGVVKVILEGDKVEFSPTLKQLAQDVGSIGTHLTESIAGISRLPDILTRKRSNKEPIYVVIEKDEDTHKIQRVINQGMQDNAVNLQNYLLTWDNYREIWEIRKDAFIRRYQKLNPQVSSFDADIARYTEVANNVATQETVLNIQFVLLDCSLLKNSILGHCHEWQNKFTELLSEIATTRLKELNDFLTNMATKVSQPPQTLDELGESLDLWSKLDTGKPETEAKFAPLYDQFSILGKYDVPVPEEIQATLDGLGAEWTKFTEALVESEGMLKKYKEKFKTSLLGQAEDFKKQVHSLVDNFKKDGPFSASLACPEALEKVATFKDQVTSLKDQEAQIRRGLGIFKIEQPPNKDIATLDKDLDYIEQIWQLTLEWEGNWDSWKVGKFVELQTSEMENASVTAYKKLAKLARELKDKNWEIVEVSKGRVDTFKRTMPLITDLKNKAMRDRHWNQIKVCIQIV